MARRPQYPHGRGLWSEEQDDGGHASCRAPSLYREPDNLWNKLTESYGKRNRIIHRGESATEDEAKLALDVAHRVVDVMRAL